MSVKDSSPRRPPGLSLLHLVVQRWMQGLSLQLQDVIPQAESLEEPVGVLYQPRRQTPPPSEQTQTAITFALGFPPELKLIYDEALEALYPGRVTVSFEFKLLISAQEDLLPKVLLNIITEYVGGEDNIFVLHTYLRERILDLPKIRRSATWQRRVEDASIPRGMLKLLEDMSKNFMIEDKDRNRLMYELRVIKRADRGVDLIAPTRS